MSRVAQSVSGAPVEVEVLVLGAGVCGVAVGAGCLHAGIQDVVLIERAEGPGGTWRHNTYPGCAVDIPSHVYSFSWAPNPDWSRVFAPQRELKAYLEKVVRDTGLDAHIRYGVEILSAVWEESIQRWRVTTTDGTYLARAYVSAAGPLHEPVLPDIPGIADLTGRSFHSSQWPDDLDLRGKRVVVLGTGASAVQFVPAIQPEAASVTVLQRTATWVLPKPDWNISKLERRVLRAVPTLMRPYRRAVWAGMDGFLLLAMKHPRIARATGVFGKLHMRRWIKDREMRRALTPTYAPTCKRLGFSNDWFRALAQPNIDLVTSAAARIHPTGVETVDGRFFEADVIIYGTGFHTLQTHPANERVVGRDGVTLQKRWNGSPTAYLGTTVAGFPNFFCMFGPNIGTLSGFTMAEAQTGYIVGALRTMRERGWGSLDVRPEEEAAFVQRCDEFLSKSTFALGGCSSYYIAADGQRISLPWPGSMTGLTRRLRTFDPAPYEAVPDTRPAVAVG